MSSGITVMTQSKEDPFFIRLKIWFEDGSGEVIFGLGRQLLTRNIGGASGGGSQLTPFAKILLESFRDIHRRITMASDRLYQQEIFSKISQTDQ
jgi:molybdate transport system regulatory protein